MTALPSRPTGAQLYDAIVQAAAVRGLTANTFAAPLGRHPHRRLEQLRGAKVPKAETIAKVAALLAGDNDNAVPTVSRSGVRRHGGKASIDSLAAKDPRIPIDAAPIRRPPCPWCATRADMHAAFGCGRPWE